MKVQLKDGTVQDLTTGKAMRLLQSGEAVPFDGSKKSLKQELEQTQDDDSKQSKSGSKGPKKNGRSDVSGD